MKTEPNAMANHLLMPGCHPAPGSAPNWATETMMMINKLTPDIKGKAFDPDWFLLRERLEEAGRVMDGLKAQNDSGSETGRTEMNAIENRLCLEQNPSSLHPVVRRSGIGSHQSAAMGKDEWLTPPDLLLALGAFDLDPCAPVTRPWPTAARHYTIEDDGLSKIWSGRIWLNPPYGDQTGEWLERLKEHGCGTALIFARTETETWFRYVWPFASAILFLRGRLYFHHVTGQQAKHNSGAPSALVAYGSADACKLRQCRLLGALWTP